MANRGIYIGMDPTPSRDEAARQLVRYVVLLTTVHAFVKIATVVAIKKLT